MTLRLSKEDERLLALLAEEDGVSRQEATIRAIHETWTETGHRFHVRTLDLDRDFTEIAVQLDDVAALLASI